MKLSFKNILGALPSLFAVATLSATATTPGVAAQVMADFPDNHEALAKQFAPSIYFDQLQKDDCFPENAADHYDKCLKDKGGVNCDFGCNHDHDGIENGKYPIYYEMKTCGDGIVIMYW